MVNKYIFNNGFDLRNTAITFLLSAFFTVACFVSCPLIAQQPSSVHVIDVSGPIGPASYSYLQQQLSVASLDGANVVIMRLNTPGGLVTSMRGMAEMIMSSDVPVVVYVSPSGAQATSAGAFLVFASHVAAMAPGTNMGAATPIPIAGETGKIVDNAGNKEATKVTQDTVKLAPIAQVKVIEDLSALMRSLAEHRGRNIEIGVAMVRQGLSYTAQELYKDGVIDYISPSLEDLLLKINDNVVTVHGKPYLIRTNNAVVHYKMPDWRNQILSIITDPNVTYIFMVLGLYGLLLEFYNPGSFYPGVIGGICLLLAGYGLHLLPVNIAGLALILLGLVFLLFEALTPSYGIFGIGGLISFVFGSLFLIDTNSVLFQVNPMLVSSVTLFNLVFFLYIIRMTFRALRAPSITGATGLIGKTCVPVEDFLDDGSVRCQGVIYRASTQAPVVKGQRLVVYDVSGNKLFVKPDDSIHPPK